MMIYSFNGFELDQNKLELRLRGTLVALEPQVFNLLILLIEQRERVVSKDDLIEDVWRSRVVSDAAIASCIRLARQAIADDGTSQHSIRTIRGHGFRFVATVSTRADDISSHMQVTSGDPKTYSIPEASNATLSENIKPSIVVLPFQLLGSSSDYDVIADAIPHDLIQALSCLRWLFVIARGTAFKFRTPDPDVLEIGKRLGVRYILVGTIEISKQATTISIELSDAQDGGVVWGETFTSALKDVHDIRSNIVARVVSSLEIHIPLHEARGARLNVSENLDAWSNYHLGLQHMFRFTRKDNLASTALFERAVAQDPSFARAYAGLSFTHFQDAFLEYDNTRSEALKNARRFAERSIELDSLDPFANFTMGRYFWLEGELDNSLDWLDRALKLSPNYAQCIYSQAFTELLLGKTSEACKNVENALMLSPLDPLQYGMFGVRALSFATDGDFENAATWAEKAARSPGAHYLISMIAVIGHSLNGNDKKASSWSKVVRQRKSDACQDQFFDSFPFRNSKTKELLSHALQRYGL